MQPAPKKFDLEDRTFNFAKNVRSFIGNLPIELRYCDDCKQLLRSSGSVGANYIEANEALSRKDFANRIKICRKEAKESHYWLRLLESKMPPDALDTCKRLIKESFELQLIFGAIVRSLNN